MAKGGSKQTVTQGVDPATQSYLAGMRGTATQGANAIMNGGPYFTGPNQTPIADQVAPFMNPYISNVVNATRGEFDFLRGQAQMATDQGATAAGAYGGSRHGVASGARLGELDRAQAGTIANLLQSGYSQALGMGTQYAEHQRQLEQQRMQEPIFRNQQAMGLYNLGLGPVGSVTTQPTQSNKWGSALGGAATGASIGSMIPGLGTAIGAGIGGLGGLLFG